MRRTTTLKLEDIARDERLRFRDRLHEVGGVTDRYAEAMRDAGGWGDFPPALVVELTADHKDTVERPGQWGRSERHELVYPAGMAVLVGGFTRCAAAAKAGVIDVPCECQPGTWEDALRLAWSQNATHGKPRSPEETRMVLESIHGDPRYAGLSAVAVAELAGCSRFTVGRYREAKADLARAFAAGDDEPADDLEPPADTPAPPPPPPLVAGPSALFAASLKDKWGRPVPPPLRQHFEVNADVDRFAKSVRALGTALGRLKHGEDMRSDCLAPGLYLLDAKKLAAQLWTLADEIDTKRPWIVCPHCDGSGCRNCNDLGWLPRDATDRLTPGLERKARSFAGASV